MVNVCKKHMSHGRHDQKSSAEQFSEKNDRWTRRGWRFDSWNTVKESRIFGGKDFGNKRNKSDDHFAPQRCDCPKDSTDCPLFRCKITMQWPKARPPWGSFDQVSFRKVFVKEHWCNNFALRYSIGIPNVYLRFLKFINTIHAFKLECLNRLWSWISSFDFIAKHEFQGNELFHHLFSRRWNKWRVIFDKTDPKQPSRLRNLRN